MNPIINFYSKCHLEYHEEDDLCSLDPPTFSEPGPRSLQECAVLCSATKVTSFKVHVAKVIFINT